MKSDQIIILVISFFLGMLVLNMIKNVCRCDIKEGFTFNSEGDENAPVSADVNICNNAFHSLTCIDADTNEMSLDICNAGENDQVFNCQGNQYSWNTLKNRFNES